MVSIQAYVITANYIIGGDGKPEIRLFVKGKDGKDYILCTTEFSPYFHVLASTNALLDHVKRMPNVTKAVMKMLKVPPGVEVPFVEVHTVKPGDVPGLRDTLRGIGLKVYAADILYPLRYMYDMGIGPFIEAEIVPYDKYSLVDKSYFLLRSIRVCPKFDIKFRYLSIDIENSMTRADRKIFCIGWVYWDEQRNDKRDGCLYGDEKSIISGLSELVRELNPDIITGYNINKYDLPHILRRAGDNDLALPLAKDGSEPIPHYRANRERGRDRTEDNEDTDEDSDIERWKVCGRLVADAWLMARAAKHPKRETLGAVAKLMGVGEKLDVDTSKIDEEWTKNPQKVMKYCVNDAELALRILIGTKMIGDGIYLSMVANLPLEMCILPRQSWLVDGIVIPAFDRAGWAVPCMNYGGEKKEKIKGAYIVQPTAGIYRWVNLIDFSAMYPSMIINYNICYTTHIPENGELAENAIKTPAGAYFRKDIEGIVPRLMKVLQDWRAQVKKRFKETGNDEDDRLQAEIKILSNAFYGLFTSDFYRFTNKAIGEAITAFARENIHGAIDYIESQGIKVLYGDTDSVFFQGGDGVDACKVQGKDIVTALSHDALRVEHDKVFRTWFTHGKKKKYIGLVAWPKEGEIYTRGYNLRRGDAFNYQETVEKTVLEGILDEKIGPDVACKAASRLIRDILKGKVNIEDLVITKSVRDPSEYDNPDAMPAVQAARKMEKMGFRFIPGTKVSFIVVDNTVVPMIVEPYIPERPDKPTPDLTYYARRCVSTVLDITEIFGYDEKGLYSGTKPTTLDRWK